MLPTTDEVCEYPPIRFMGGLTIPAPTKEQYDYFLAWQDRLFGRDPLLDYLTIPESDTDASPCTD